MALHPTPTPRSACSHWRTFSPWCGMDVRLPALATGTVGQEIAVVAWPHPLKARDGAPLALVTCGMPFVCLELDEKEVCKDKGALAVARKGAKPSVVSVCACAGGFGCGRVGACMRVCVCLFSCVCASVSLWVCVCVCVCSCVKTTEPFQNRCEVMKCLAGGHPNQIDFPPVFRVRKIHGALSLPEHTRRWVLPSSFSPADWLAF